MAAIIGMRSPGDCAAKRRPSRLRDPAGDQPLRSSRGQPALYRNDDYAAMPSRRSREPAALALPDPPTARTPTVAAYPGWSASPDALPAALLPHHRVRDRDGGVDRAVVPSCGRNAEPLRSDAQQRSGADSTRLSIGNGERRRELLRTVLAKADREAPGGRRCGSALIPVVSSFHPFACAGDPRIAGQGREPTRFGAERIPCCAECIHDSLLVLVKAEREIAFANITRPAPPD